MNEGAAPHLKVRPATVRNAPIDLLRGVAITLVLLLHYSLTYRLSQSPLADWFGRDAVRAVVNNGNYGVTMFFVVSGFLITSNLLRRHGSLDAIDLRGFYVMRAARILPSLVLALLIIVPLGLAGITSFGNVQERVWMPAPFMWLAAGSVLTFTHNVLMQSVGYFNYCLNIYWSLSVEEVFYLGFPLLCLLARRQSLIVAAAIAAIVIGPMYRSMHADDELYFMYGYAACFDAIAFGCLAALAVRWRTSDAESADASRAARDTASSAASGVTKGRALALAASLGLASAYLAGIRGHEVGGFTAIAACSALIVYACGASTHPGWADAKFLSPLRWAGRHSYELYLFHIVVLAGMRELVSRDQLGYALKLPWLVLFLALSAGVAALVAKFFSEPINAALRSRFIAARVPTRDARAVPKAAEASSAG